MRLYYYLGDSLMCLSSSLWASAQLVGSGSCIIRHSSGCGVNRSAGLMSVYPEACALTQSISIQNILYIPHMLNV